MEREIEELKKIIQQVPGAPKQIPKYAQTSYVDSPFARWITETQLPKRFTYPSMNQYDGTGDPDEHMAHFKQRMLAAPILDSAREACMCKGFGMSLTGPALKWFTKLPVRSISSFAQLQEQFTQQFSSSRRMQKTSADLYRMHMYRGETTRSWVTRFNTERLTIDKPDKETSINAFRKGIFVDLDLYKELTKHPCDTYAGVMLKGEDQMRWEEDYTARYACFDPEEEDKDPESQDHPDQESSTSDSS